MPAKLQASNSCSMARYTALYGIRHTVYGIPEYTTNCLDMASWLLFLNGGKPPKNRRAKWASRLRIHGCKPPNYTSVIRCGTHVRHKHTAGARALQLWASWPTQLLESLHAPRPPMRQITAHLYGHSKAACGSTQCKERAPAMRRASNAASESPRFPAMSRNAKHCQIVTSAAVCGCVRLLLVTISCSYYFRCLLLSL